MEALGRGAGEERPTRRDEPGPKASHRESAEDPAMGSGCRTKCCAAMRELVRLQALASSGVVGTRTRHGRDSRRARQQLLRFLLRHEVHYPGSHWSKAPPSLTGPLVVGSQLRASGPASGSGKTRAADCRDRLVQPDREPAPADGLSAPDAVGACERPHDPMGADHPLRQEGGPATAWRAPAQGLDRGRGDLDLALSGACRGSSSSPRNTCPSRSGLWGGRRRSGSADAIAS